MSLKKKNLPLKLINKLAQVKKMLFLQVLKNTQIISTILKSLVNFGIRYPQERVNS